MSSLFFSEQTQTDKFSRTLCWGLFFLLRTLVSFCFVVTVLLSFLKLMQNAFEGEGRREDVVIKVKADVLQSRFVTLYSPQKKREREEKKNRYGGSTNVASELVPANPARAKLDCAFVFCVRDTEPLQETPHSSEWNLSSTWACRLESDNLRWLVTSEFSLSTQPFRGSDTQLLKLKTVQKIIYWCYLLDFALRVALNIQMILEY